MLPQIEQENQILEVDDEQLCRAMMIVTSLVYEQIIPISCPQFRYEMETFEYAVKVVAGLLAHFAEHPKDHAPLPFNVPLIK